MAQITEKLTAITKLIETLPKSTNNANGARFGGYGIRKPVGWIPMDIVGAVVTMLTKNTTVRIHGTRVVT
eukprot:12651026-Ditylum_brightwellii.AAC.1